MHKNTKCIISVDSGTWTICPANIVNTTTIYKSCSLPVTLFAAVFLLCSGPQFCPFQRTTARKGFGDKETNGTNCKRERARMGKNTTNFNFIFFSTKKMNQNQPKLSTSDQMKYFLFFIRKKNYIKFV